MRCSKWESSGHQPVESRLSLIFSWRCHVNSEPLSPWCNTGVRRSGVCSPKSLAAPAGFRSWMLRGGTATPRYRFPRPP